MSPIIPLLPDQEQAYRATIKKLRIMDPFASPTELQRSLKERGVNLDVRYIGKLCIKNEWEVRKSTETRTTSKATIRSEANLRLIMAKCQEIMLDDGMSATGKKAAARLISKIQMHL